MKTERKKKAKEILKSLDDTAKAATGPAERDPVMQEDPEGNVDERDYSKATFIRPRKRQKLLDSSVELHQIKLAKEGNANAMSLLVQQYRPLVEGLAFAKSPERGQPDIYDDLVQEGFLGLMEAIRKFDLKRRNRLGPYARDYIALAMLRYLTGSAHAIRVPRFVHEYKRRKEKCAKLLEKRLGRSPTAREIADCANLTMHQSKYTDLPSSQTALSLDALLEDEDKMPVNTDLVDKAEINQTDFRAQYNECADYVRSILDEFPDRTKTALELKYGLTGEKPHSYQKIGDVLGLSRFTARQIVLGAEKKIRKNYQKKASSYL